MNKKKLSKLDLSHVTAGIIMALLIAATSHVEQSGRPDDMRLANFQFGPNNRWAFSHMREVIPTVNIAHDQHRVLTLLRSENASKDFSIEFQRRSQRLEEIADQQYMDGILILKRRKDRR